MGLSNLFTSIGGTVIDCLVGDPRCIPHPVVGIGKIISWLDNLFNHKEFKPWLLRIFGIVTVIVVVGIVYCSSYFLFKWLTPFSWLFWIVNLWLMNTTIAAKGLNQAGQGIYRLLKESNLIQARKEVGQIVGRDTENLSQEEIIRATVETIAENAVDGVISPLFFGLLGGTSLALAYRAINTLDSMIGYKNERYRYFGWAAAKLDDIANLIPARICAFLMFISTAILGFNWRESIKVTFRDAKKHPSPNGGWPEAAVAGALGIRLGGQNYYQGVASFRRYLGDATRDFEVEDIKRAIRILNTTVNVTLVVSSLLILGLLKK